MKALIAILMLASAASAEDLAPLFRWNTSDDARKPASIQNKLPASPRFELLVQSGRKATIFQIVPEGSHYRVHYFNNVGQERAFWISTREYLDLENSTRTLTGTVSRSDDCIENQVVLTLAAPYKHSVSSCLKAVTPLRARLVALANRLASKVK